MRRKDIKRLIEEYFFVNPAAKLRVRQLEKELDLPIPSVIRYCRELEKEGILKTIQTGNVVFYTADRASGKFLLEKRLHNIRSLYDSGIVDFLIKEYNNPAIIVFGSYARGEDIETSDIDIYVETPSKNGIKIPESRAIKTLKRRIQLFVHKNTGEIGNKELANNILNGIVLNGFVEVFR
jgi:predicted nucleotidyltransferase